MNTYKTARKLLLSAFTIGDLDNPVLAQAITEKLEQLDEMVARWVDVLLKIGEKC